MTLAWDWAIPAASSTTIPAFFRSNFLVEERATQIVIAHQQQEDPGKTTGVSRLTESSAGRRQRQEARKGSPHREGCQAKRSRRTAPKVNTWSDRLTVNRCCNNSDTGHRVHPNTASTNQPAAVGDWVVIHSPSAAAIERETERGSRYRNCRAMRVEATGTSDLISAP